ncbi:MAG: hypothetical protein ABI569_02200 [Casimicrobiaceae bacterium]
MWAGILLGLVGAAIVAFVVVALGLLGSVPVMLLISTGFDDARPMMLLLGLIVAALAAAATAIWALGRWILPMFFGQRRSGPGWSAFLLGLLLGIALALSMTPFAVWDMATLLTTGETIAARAPLPADEEELRRLRERVRPAAQAGDPAAQVELALALRRGAAGEARDREEAAVWTARAASHPEGFEARLLLALNTRAEPVPRGGRMAAESDSAVRVEALRRLRPRLPADWQPALLGTVGEVQRTHSGEDPDDQPMRDSMAEAGRAGSRAFAVLAAEYDEAMAIRDDRDGRIEQADAGWRRALEGYSIGGAAFEIARLRDETLPERLRTMADPPAGASGPASDAAVALRFWRFAWALDADYVDDRTAPKERDVASAMALLAMERSPDPAKIASLNPAKRWFSDPWAIGRWLLALRHARGDCAAALTLSDSTRNRRRPPVVGAPNWAPSMLDFAWALAWLEAAERCALTDDERSLALERRHLLEPLPFKPGELASARAGVASTIATLR